MITEKDAFFLGQAMNRHGFAAVADPDWPTPVREAFARGHASVGEPLKRADNAASAEAEEAQERR
jgi:hypothetical protein